MLLSLREQHDPAKLIRQRLITQADSLQQSVTILGQTPIDVAHSHILQARFRSVRLVYKRLEWAKEYFDPLTTRQVNGPPVPEAELNGAVIQPDGLQVIEADLFPRFSISKKKELTGLISRLITNTAEFKAYFEKADLQDWQILDATKREIFRVEILGLNNLTRCCKIVFRNPPLRWKA